MSISMDAEIAAQVREAALRAGVPLSAWMADAARAKLRHESLAAFLDEYQAEHGAFTEEELEQARARLGPPAS